MQRRNHELIPPFHNFLRKLHTIIIKAHYFATICSDFLNSNQLICFFDQNLVSFGANVPFLKSLVCIEGHDNGRRFLAISIVFYMLLLVFLPIYQKAGILVFLLIIVTTPVLLASSLRRINDAGFMALLATIPTVIFWVNIFGLVYLDHSSKWILLLLGMICTLVISTISNIRVRHNHHYQWGYHGSVNSSGDNNKNDIDRVEPTLATNIFEGLNTNDVDSHQLNPHLNKASSNSKEEIISSHTHHHSFKQQFFHWFNHNRNLALAGLSVSLLFLILILFISSSLNNPDTPNPQTEVQNQTFREFKKERNHKLEMPDNFWLMLDQNNALTIGWEGDSKKDGHYWSAMTGKGDKTCTDLHFSLGNNIRTLQVTVVASEDYYADFSPVDTKFIIESIANKDRFKLCGYEFVLKGTRSLLRQHEFYREYLDIGFRN